MPDPNPLANLYDQLRKAAVFTDEDPDHPDAPVFQMVKHMVLDPDDFTNAFSPLNVKGSQARARAFAALVDKLPKQATPLWVDSGLSLSGAYTGLVSGADSATPEDPDQLAVYRKMQDLLTTTAKVKTTDENGAEVEMVETRPTPLAAAYEAKRAAYGRAVSAYRVAYNAAKRSETFEEDWSAIAQPLQDAVDSAWQAWNDAGRKIVEDARNRMASTINDAVSSAIAHAAEAVSESRRYPDLTPGGEPWLLSYALPGNWAAPNAAMASFSFDSRHTEEESSRTATTFAGSLGGSVAGLEMSGSASYSSTEDKSRHLKAGFRLSADLLLVQIVRPWFNPVIFGMRGWWSTGYQAGEFSSNAVPAIPTSLVVARNLTITSEFDEDARHDMSKALNVEGEVKGGIGILTFSVKGSFNQGESQKSFTSSFDGKTLKVPGLHVVGFVSTRTPPNVPPMAKK